MHNWRIPGRKPGTSTKVMMGILKASQKRTKRAPFTEELMSKQPDKETEMKDWTANLKTHHSSIIIQLTLPLFHIHFQNADKEERWSYAHNIILLTRSNFGLVTHDAYSASVHAGEPHHNVFGVAGHDLKEVPLIHYLKRCMQKCLPLAEVKWGVVTRVLIASAFVHILREWCPTCRRL